MQKIDNLSQKVSQILANRQLNPVVNNHELTIEVAANEVRTVMCLLRDEPDLQFNQLIDLCGVDYLLYGDYDWETESASESGFSRGVERQQAKAYALEKPRFAVVYHLLSTTLNHRIRIKIFLSEESLVIDTVHDVWKAADWFEREAYDLYGILFSGHPDLRRLLTDYGFIGHPFRKDFPLSGHVEMRYDATLKKVVYEPVDIEPRITVPKVIRNDNRYVEPEAGE